MVTTPYFIPGQPFQNALETAVLRGAEVHLIVDDHMDQFLVGNAQRSYYEELLAAGVQIHACTDAFLHAKSVSFEGQVAWIGTCNMDMRSFNLNFELNAFVFDRGVCSDLASQFRLDLEAANETWAKERADRRAGVRRYRPDACCSKWKV